jgi:hypothetical protein
MSRSRNQIRKSPRAGERIFIVNHRGHEEPKQFLGKEAVTTSPDLSLNVCVPNGPRIFACAIRYFDAIVFAQLLPLRSIGTDLDPTSVIEHPNFHNPLFIIGRPLVFDLLALFCCDDIVLPDYDGFAACLFAAAKSSDQ